MLISIAPALLLLSSTLAAPSNDYPQQLNFSPISSDTSNGLTSLAYKWTTSLFSSIEIPSFFSFGSGNNVNQYGLSTKDETKTLWKIINENEHFSQLAHVLNYSSDATKKLLDDENARITLFAPINWYHNKSESLSPLNLLTEETSLGSTQQSLAFSDLSQIESQIQDFERISILSKDDDDKERRRRIISHIIDAILSYHIVDSEELLNYDEISRNSTVASKLNLSKNHENKLDILNSFSEVDEKDFPNLNDGQAWRIRVGKSLLPLPAVYLNFYSRVVSPDHQVKNGLLHAISAPLLPPPSVLQSIYFGIPDYASVAASLLKTGGADYLDFPHHHHENDTSIEYQHPGSTALTFFAPGNSAFYKLPMKLRLFLFSPFGKKWLGKLLMLHSLPFDIVFADSIHHVKAHKTQSFKVGNYNEISETYGSSNITKYTFKSALPKLNCTESQISFKGSAETEFEEVDVEIARYYLLPGSRGPLQTRMKVQGISILLQDIPSANGVWHTITSFIKPKGHSKEEGIWIDIVKEAEEKGFGKVDLKSLDWD